MTTNRSCGHWPAISHLVKTWSSCNARGVLPVVVFLLLFSVCIQAQTAHFGYALSTLGSGFSQPTQIALDASGNVYMTDESNQAVYELTAASGYSTVKTLSTQFTIPTGIAVDANANVFVTDQGTARVFELTAASNYATAITLGSGFSNPNGVAVDSAGNVFVADTLNNVIKEILAVNGSIPASNPTINTLAGSYNHPTDVAVDSSGNVFVADLFNSAIKEILATGGYTTVNTLASGFSYPVGVALDTSGNVYVADSGNNAIKEILATGGYTTVNTLASSLPYPTGVAVNSAGNVFIAAFSGSAVFELTLHGAVGFSSLPVATTNPETINLNFVFDTGGTIAAPAVLTLGASGLDFVDAGTGTCTTNGTSHSYGAGDTCTVAVRFTPTFSGSRYGAVTLSNNSGTLIATEYLSGTGIGPQIIFSKNNLQTTLGGSFTYPISIALDGSANVFLAEPTIPDVKEIRASGGYASVQTLGSGFSQPAGVAVDGAGNLIVADYGNSQVDQVVAKGGYTTVNVLANYTTFNAPNGVAVDGNANIFVTDQVNGAVYEMVAASGYATVNSLAGGFSNPNGVAVDGSGNVYVADTGNNAIKEVVAVGGVIPNSPTVLTLGGGFSSPNAVAVDASGALFVADSGNAAVKAMPAGCLSSACVSSLGAGFNSPYGVALSGNGNLFLVDYLSGLAKELNFSSPPSLTFASTAIGSSSSDSPKTVTLTNDGNAQLTLEVPDTGSNPNLSTGFTFSNTSTCPQLTSSSTAATLAAGASCAAAVSFTPVATGSITGNMVITDDSLNAAGPTYTTQSIALSGTATPPPVTATTVIPSTSLTRNHAATPFIPVTASGGSGELTYSIAPALPAGLTFSTTTGTVSGTPTAVSAATTYTVTVSSPETASGTATFSLTVKSAVAAVTAIASTTLTQNHSATGFVPVTGSGGTSPLAYSIAPALPAGLSLSSSTGGVSGTPTATSATATYTVTVTDNNGATASATFSLTVNPAVATATATVLTSSNNAPAFGTSVVLTATVTPASTDQPPGTVNFYAGRTLLGTSALNSAGVATLSTMFPQGSATITAVYSGSARYAGSTSNALSVSALAGTSLALSASPTTQLYNNPVVLSAQVTSATSGILTGTVTFLDGTTTIATVPVAMNGQASYSVNSLAQGSHSLNAAYSGDGNFQTSTSTGTGVAITVGNINLSLGNDQNQTVLPGGAATYMFPLSPVVTPTFLYDVKLTATGLPPGATYTFSPASIPAGSGTVPVTLTVQTAKGTASLTPPAPGGPLNSSRGLAALAIGLLVPLFGLKRAHRRLRTIPKALALVIFTAGGLCATLVLNGCGAGGFFGHTATSGSYTITVTATSADLVRTSTVQLTIQ